MAEWSNAAVLKTAEPETVPGVRIPLLPPLPNDWEFLISVESPQKKGPEYKTPNPLKGWDGARHTLVPGYQH